jgi:ATP-binding cassette subfamily C (CFTR/MRP) protein 1
MYAVQRVYLRTSQRIRHMDLETKAPLYAQFTDALNGAASIRAFNWQSPSRNENDTLLDNNQRPFYLLFCVQRKSSYPNPS